MKVYTGLTTLTLAARWNKHQSDAATKYLNVLLDLWKIIHHLECSSTTKW